MLKNPLKTNDINILLCLDYNESLRLEWLKNVCFFKIIPQHIRPLYNNYKSLHRKIYNLKGDFLTLVDFPDWQKQRWKYFIRNKPAFTIPRWSAKTQAAAGAVSSSFIMKPAVWQLLGLLLLISCMVSSSIPRTESGLVNPTKLL